MIKKLTPPDYLLIYILLALVLNCLFPIKLITTPHNFIGVALIILGGLINIWADRLFKKVKTPVKPTDTPLNLLIEGPFRISRNPMYLGFVMILIGTSIFLGTLPSFISPVLMFLTLNYTFIPYEETQMESIFGKKYLDYKKKVKRWF